MIGQIISHYKILEKLGGGGMGVVYKAEDTKLERTVALKFLPPEWTRDEDAKARFLHEAKAASKLDHNNICTIHEIGETEDGQMFIAMACYDGETLKKKIARGPLKVDDAIDLAVQIAQGLEKAHSQKITHRDIKPANVMVTDDGVAKIVDFGLAKLAGRTKLTKEGATLGTVAYMSPEQAQGEKIDHRSDIWSLGVVLYEMLTGQLPFDAEYEQAVIYSIVQEDPEPITALRTGVPMELERIVNKCLAKKPEERYQHVGDVLVDLRRISANLDSEKTVAQATDTTQKARSAFLWPAVALSAIILSIVSYFFFDTESESEERIPIAVVDFVNETGEEELSSLSGMLITSLEQSRRLSVLTRSRMFDILNQLGKKDAEHIDETLARDICKHANIPALAIATIQKLDELYVVDLKVIDPVSDVYLATAREEGQGKSRIPAMLDRLSEKTREKLQEQVADIQASNRQVAELTTSNMQAYYHYFLGDQRISKGNLWTPARNEFKHAISLDSTFALAYYKLAYCYKWWEQMDEAKKYIQIAMRFIHKAPEKERYLIRALEAEIERNPDKSIAISQELLKRHPSEKAALWQIGEMYNHFKADREIARSYFEKALELDPSFGLAWSHIFSSYDAAEQYDKLEAIGKRAYQATQNYGYLYEAYLRLGDFDKARVVLKKMAEQNPESTLPIQRLTDIYIFEDKYKEAEENQKRVIDTARPLRGTYRLAMLYIYLGRYHDALQIFDSRISAYARSDNLYEISNNLSAKVFLFAAGLDDFEKANSEIDNLTQYPTDTWVQTRLFHTYIIMGDYDKASSYAQLYPGPAKGGIRQIYAQAQAHVANRRYHEAIKDFQTSIEKGAPRDLLYKRYNLALCYFAAGQYDLAITEIQKAQKRYFHGDDYHIYRAIVYPKGFYLLGKIYEQKGDTQLAIENYEKFLQIWKDADEDLPDLIDAKARLANLKAIWKI